MNRTRVAVVMPAFNEHSGIGSFVQEIDDQLAPCSDLAIVVVDDASPDPLEPVLRAVEPRLRCKLVVLRNATNRGHGPSALRAYREGLSLDPDVIIHVDGDGQFKATDFALLIEALEQSEIVYGVRTNRRDPWFRRILSAALRAWVDDDRIQDVNTPLRAYRPAALTELLAQVPADSLIPHVRFAKLSAASRRDVSGVPVEHSPRRGESAQGTSWGKRERRVLPPMALVRFCFRATRELLTLSRGTEHLAAREAALLVEQ